VNKIHFLLIFSSCLSVVGWQNSASAAKIIGVKDGEFFPSDVCSWDGPPVSDTNLPGVFIVSETVTKVEKNCQKTFSIQNSLVPPTNDINKLKFKVKNLSGTEWTDFHFGLNNTIGAKFVGTVQTGSFGNCKLTATSIDCNTGTVVDGSTVELAFSVEIPDSSLSTLTMTNRATTQPPPPIPEPSAILSLLALGTLGAASTLKRKLKSSKSTEKEKTKVG
jgi:hypothetical protein